VYTVTDKKGDRATVKQTIIKTGKFQGQVIEVLEGLKAGDEILIEGARSVIDGQKIQILK
jgi:multidrug efflux pump subunit AcrA (membrane-fusion protein)